MVSFHFFGTRTHPHLQIQRCHVKSPSFTISSRAFEEVSIYLIRISSFFFSWHQPLKKTSKEIPGIEKNTVLAFYSSNGLLRGALISFFLLLTALPKEFVNPQDPCISAISTLPCDTCGTDLMITSIQKEPLGSLVGELVSCASVSNIGINRLQKLKKLITSWQTAITQPTSSKNTTNVKQPSSTPS